jgi:hypothetical protein
MNQFMLEQYAQNLAKQIVNPDHELHNLYCTLQQSVESQIKVLNGVL